MFSKGKIFYVKGRIKKERKKNCIFKVDTGLDVTLIRERLLKFTKQQISRVVYNRSFNLRYSTGEKVPIKFEVRVWVELEFSMKLPVYVVDMKDDCLLGNDFLSAMNFEEVFASFFGIPSQREEEVLFSDYVGDW